MFIQFRYNRSHEKENISASTINSMNSQLLQSNEVIFCLVPSDCIQRVVVATQWTKTLSLSLNFFYVKIKNPFDYVKKILEIHQLFQLSQIFYIEYQLTWCKDVYPYTGHQTQHIFPKIKLLFFVDFLKFLSHCTETMNFLSYVCENALEYVSISFFGLWHFHFDVIQARGNLYILK